ncbi:MAG: protein-disulfide reductase DsbD domain-containing protein [Propylenella sp.]
MTGALFRVALAFALTLPAAAHAVRSDWAAADAAKMRVLLAGPSDDSIVGGIEFALEPGWYTYWRNPGEAGVPPAFDFSGSENVADVAVLYPTPERYDDGTSVSLIYRDEVVFPLAVTPARPGEPVTLSVEAVFGVCSEVCVPTRASAAATLPPAAPHDALSEALLERFLARVPKPAEPGHFEVESVTVVDEALLIDVRMPDSAFSDLFADPPEGWYIGQPEFVSRSDGVSRYRLSLAGSPEDGEVRGQTFRFVAVAGGEAIEEAIEIR